MICYHLVYLSMHRLNTHTSLLLCLSPFVERHLSRLSRHATPFAQYTPSPHPYDLLDRPLIAHQHSQALCSRLPWKVASRVRI